MVPVESRPFAGTRTYARSTDGQWLVYNNEVGKSEHNRSSSRLRTCRHHRTWRRTDQRQRWHSFQAGRLRQSVIGSISFRSVSLRLNRVASQTVRVEVFNLRRLIFRYHHVAMMNRPLILKSIPFGMPMVKHQQTLGETPFMTRVTVSRSDQNCLASTKLTRLQISNCLKLRL